MNDEHAESVEQPDPRLPRPEAAKKPYAPPRLTVHGPVAEATAQDTTSFLGDNPTPSDRALKDGFAPVDPRAILAGVLSLPIETWSYKTDRPPVRHIGPMAQDFAAAFGVGRDDRHIDLLDANGVALAAIQALHALVETQAAEIRALRGEAGRLREAVAGLRAALESRDSRRSLVPAAAAP
jgi:hypothetical protein